VTLSRGHEQQVFDGRALDGLGDGKREVPPKEAYRLALDVLGELPIPRLRQPELVVRQEAARVIQIREIEPLPVDDGATRQDEPKRLQVMKGKLIVALEPKTRQRRNALGRTRRVALGIVQCCVVVASPAWGRRRERVPKKIPRVTPRTTS
jgi:hypothetical protein